MKISISFLQKLEQILDMKDVLSLLTGRALGGCMVIGI